MNDLEDALDKYDRTGSAYGNVGLIVKAARLVAVGKVIAWCDQHGSVARPIEDECYFAALHSVAGCHIADQVLIDPPEEI